MGDFLVEDAATKPCTPFRRRVPAPPPHRTTVDEDSPQHIFHEGDSSLGWSHPLPMDHGRDGGGSPQERLPPPPPPQPLANPDEANGPPAPPNGGEATARGAATTATDRESFYARILAEGPSVDEVAARATPAYVKSLIQTISRNEEDTAKVLNKLEELRRRREQHHIQEAKTVRAQMSELQVLRQQVAQLTLQLQEERERSTRLLHENTVLCAQEAEQQERLAALVELAQSRGRALQQLRRRGEGLDSVPGALRSVRPSSSPSPPANNLSLRAVALGGVAPSNANYSLQHLQQQRKEESIVVGDASRSDEQQREASLEILPGEGNVGDDAELMAALQPSVNAAAAHIAALAEEVQMLRQQLDEQRAVYERERGVRLQQERDEHAGQLETHERLTATIQQLEELHECALRDLVVYRHRSDRDLRDLRGQVDWLKQSLSVAIEAAESAKRQHHMTATAMSLRAADHYRPRVRSLAMELTSKRQTVLQERKAFEAAMMEKDALVEKLRAAVKQEKEARRRAEERHRLEVRGVRSELDLMRQSLRQVEKKVFFTRAREAAAMMEEQNLMEYYHHPA